MYAVIETGGKQYRVEVGSELEIERLEAGPGESVAFDRVLLVADGDAASIGRPVVANASVAAEVVRRDRGDKVISFKYRPKARRRVKKGHRQELTVVRISDIVLDGKSAAKEYAKAEEARLTERQRLEEGARRQAAKDAELAAKLAADAKAATAKRGAAAKDADARPAAKAKAKAADTTDTKDAPAPSATKDSGPAKGAAKATATKGTAARGTAAKPAAKATKSSGGTSDTKTPRTRKGGED
jgi:large subunit ribosomal protein L21